MTGWLDRRRDRATTAAGRRKAPGWVRGGALFSIVSLLGVGMVLGDPFTAQPTRMTDGTAWLPRGDDLVRGSAYTNTADWLVSGAAGGTVGPDGIGQDGSDVLVVVGDRAFSIDESTLAPSKPIAVGRKSQALVRNGRAYVVSNGGIDCIRPGIGTKVGRSIPIGGSGRGVVDDRGVLWVAVKRSGRLYQVRSDDRRCTLERKVDRVFPAGHDVQISLAGGRVVLYDRDAGRLLWIDQRTGETTATATVPKGGQLQGPSSQGGRAWVSGPGTRLTGVDPKGRVVRTELSVGSLLRPEVLDGAVVVPSSTGQVVVVDAQDGEPPRELRRKPLPAAAEDDFVSFIKDDQAWFSAQGTEQAGTIASNGEVEDLRVDEKALQEKAEEPPPPVEEITPITSPPPTTPDTTPSGGSTPATIPAGPGGPDGSTPATIEATTTTQPSGPALSSSTTSTTAAPVAVPDVRGQSPDAACQRLAEVGLGCNRSPYPQLGSPALQVIEQSPASGAVMPGTAVEIRFYTDAGVQVPDVSSAHAQDQASACQALIDAGLGCAPPTVQAFQGNGVGVAPGRVWGQSVAAGTTVPSGSQVAVTIEPTSGVWDTDLFQCRTGDSADPVAVIRAGESCPGGFSPSGGSWARCSSLPGGGREPIYRMNPAAGAQRFDGGPLVGTLVLAEGSFADNAGKLGNWDVGGRQVICYGYFANTSVPPTGGTSRAALVNTSHTYVDGGAFEYTTTENTSGTAVVFRYF